MRNSDNRFLPSGTAQQPAPYHLLYFHIRSFLSALLTDSTANTKEMAVRIIGNTALSDIVKSPTLAWVRKISKNEVTTAAFEDFAASPTNSAIKLRSEERRVGKEC